MANDDEDKEHKGSYLDRREEFPGWRRDMKMPALCLAITMAMEGPLEKLQPR